jgi:transcriptional regulator with XRE-family HTH domain
MVRGTPNPRYSGLPARLRKARKQSGLTSAALGQRVGRGAEVASYVETGHRLPTCETLARLASGLGVSAAWLAFGIGEQLAEGPPATCDGMGSRLAVARAERSTSKAELARLTELSPRSIAKIEAGGQSGVEVIEEIADGLGVSPAWLAFNQGPQVLPSRRGGRPPSVRIRPASLPQDDATTGTTDSR